MNYRLQKQGVFMSNNIKIHINNLIASNTSSDEDYQDHLAEIIESLLDDYAMDDGFGTEGQSDPRGDCRDGDFSMFFVEGAEKESQKVKNEVVLKRIKDLINNDEYFEEYLNEQECLFNI